MVYIEVVMKVTLPHDPKWYALEWAIKNCPSYITNDAETVMIDKYGLEVYTKVNYYFSDEKDAIIFQLRWS